MDKTIQISHGSTLLPQQMKMAVNYRLCIALKQKKTQ